MYEFFLSLYSIFFTSVHRPPSLIYRERFLSTSQGEDHKIHITHIQFCIAHITYLAMHMASSSGPRVVLLNTLSQSHKVA